MPERAGAKSPYGIVLGRFQPFHLDHLRYLAAAKERCDRLVVGITNPDPTPAGIVEADAARSRPENNPLTYLERHLMIEASLREDGWSPADYLLVAAPLTRPDRLMSYLPPPARSVVLLTVYDAWGEQKARELEALGYRTEILWRKDPAERAMTERDYELARQLAEQAQIDAKLAGTMARSSKAQKAADALQEGSRVLRQEIDRQTQ